MNLELFPCSGGFAEGFRRAGMSFDLAIDYDAEACDSYHANHGHRPVQMDVRDLLRMVRLGWRPAQDVDFICADPPCTPWSRAGKRLGTDDERDMLGVTVEVIRLLRPRSYLIGNVPGLQDATNWPTFQRSLGPLSAAGYCIADYAQLDAANYGTPQRRLRPFWFGHRSGPCIQWPAPSHGDPLTIGDPRLDGRKPWVTCRQALGHLSANEIGRPVRLKWKSETDHRPSDPDSPARTVTGNANGDGVTLALNKKHPINTLDRPSYTVTAKGDGRGALGSCALRLPQGMRTGSADKPGYTVTAKPSRIGAGSGHVLDWQWDWPSTTILSDERLSVPGHHDATVGNSSHNGPNAVIVSEKAAAILQGFPESWKFCGKTKRARWAQLGMAMPPQLAEAVARSVHRQMVGTELALLRKESA